MRAFCILLISFNLLIFVEADNNNNEVRSESSEVHIVYMGAKTCTNGDPRNDHIRLMNELNTRVVRIYNRSFLGFAARLSEEEAKSIARTPGVVSVYPDSVVPLHTTRSWDFLRSQHADGRLTINNAMINSSSYSSESNWSTQTQDTIIGIIDTGIWPEHPSFNDRYMSAIPSHWNGTCMADENSTSFPCNKKVIGVRYYDDPDEPGYITTARDTFGHGSHTASIAAGKPVDGASYYNSLAVGTAIGGSPSSRIAVYCVCNNDGCVGSAILHAFDDAIADGLDVISLSMGTVFDGLFNDVISIGSFHAVEKGITVVTAAGNDGPSPRKVRNVAPWIMNVAATTIDRDIESTVVLGNNERIKAGGINFSNLRKYAAYRLVEGRHSARSNRPSDVANSSNCMPGSLDDDKVKGKIILCEDEGDFDLLMDKIYSLYKQGAAGMIMINDERSLEPYDYGTVAFAAVTKFDGKRIRSYIMTSRNPLATILPSETIMNYKPAPVVAFFSSRGPINGILNLIKPDVSAPGVGILAAWLPQRTSGGTDVLFKIDSGTSMSCPHVSGLAATVKSWHPTWSPSAIRSAIMTTAIYTNNLNAPIKTHFGSTATPYDMGAGEISLLGPLCPGLVYETETIDYLNFLCNMGHNTSMIKTISSNVPPNFDCPRDSSPDLISDMNYPSIAVSGLKANVGRTVKRTVTNVGEPYSTYAVSVEAPAGLYVQVVPNKLLFTKTRNKLSFRVTFRAVTTSPGYSFGSITWFDRKHNVRIPFVANNA